MTLGPAYRELAEQVYFSLITGQSFPCATFPPPGPHSWSAFLVGLFITVACSHCIAPTLYAVLLYAGGTGSAVTDGALMLALGAIMIAGKLPWLTQVITSVWPYRPPVGM